MRKEKFEAGQLVWAKMNSYPPWPAYVNHWSFFDNLRSKKGLKMTVTITRNFKWHFFVIFRSKWAKNYSGDFASAVVRLKDLQDFNEKTIQKNTPKLPKKRLTRAIEMASRIFEGVSNVEG